MRFAPWFVVAFQAAAYMLLWHYNGWRMRKIQAEHIARMRQLYSEGSLRQHQHFIETLRDVASACCPSCSTGLGRAADEWERRIMQ